MTRFHRQFYYFSLLSSVGLHILLAALLFYRIHPAVLPVKTSGNTPVIITTLYQESTIQPKIQVQNSPSSITHRTVIEVKKKILPEKKESVVKKARTINSQQKTGAYNALAIFLHNAIYASIQTLAPNIPDYLKNRSADIRFQVNDNGEIKQASIMQSSGNRRLDQLAMSAVNLISPVHTTLVKQTHDEWFDIHIQFD